MSEKAELTEQITKYPPNEAELRLYCRLNKIDYLNLRKLALLYQDLKKNHPLATPLHVACQTNIKPYLVKTLVKEGWSVNHHAGDLGTPLELALDLGNISFANLLVVELGAEFKKFGYTGVTPMFFALNSPKKEKTCFAAVKLLLDAGVSVNAEIDSESQQTPIHVAVLNCLPSVVSYLLQKGAHPNVQDINGAAPIHFAVYKKHLNIVKILLLHGVDVHLKTKTNETPLCLAVKLESAEIIQELVKGGCDINRSSWNGKFAPFHIAVFLNKLEIVKLMVSLGANPNKALSSGTTPLHGLATRDLDKLENSHDRVDMAEYLVANGANLNVIDSNGNSPLQVSIISNFLGLAKCFVKLGANINTKDLDGNTILHQVVPLNRDITILLLEFGGDFYAYNRNGLTPYHIAITHNVNLKYIRSFLKHGCPYDQDLPIWTKIVKNCKVGKQFFESEKTFFQGIKENNMELINTAISEGALAASCSEDMKYPLHFVALQGYNEVLTFLLQNNIHPNTLDEKGRTALHLAASSGHYETCRILLRFGACYNYQSKKFKKTPRMIAHELKHSEVVNLFDSVDDMFLKAHLNQHVVEYFKNKLKCNFDYLMYANAINIKGDTLLATVLKNKHNVDAEELMKMRLRCELDQISNHD